MCAFYDSDQITKNGSKDIESNQTFLIIITDNDKRFDFIGPEVKISIFKE